MVDNIKSLFLSETGNRIYNSAVSDIIKHNMRPLLEKGVLVGLSGGADSVMLLCFLLEYREKEELGFPILAAHINHGIRGEEADRDEEFCRQLCSWLNVEFAVTKCSVPNMAKEKGLGIEEAARIARYSAFNDIIRGRSDISTIAVAHNMSDNAETVIFNLLRGSGTRGAAGIRPVRDNIVRPLISVNKCDIVAALDYVDFYYVTDSTNTSTDYTRNYIRHEIVPKLAHINEDPERMLKRFSDNARSDDDFITSLAVDFIEERNIITNRDLRDLHYSIFLRVLKIMAENAGAGISSRIAYDIYALLDRKNFSYSLIGGFRFICERGVCSVVSNYTIDDYHFDIINGKTVMAPFSAEFLLSTEKVEKTYSNVYKIAIQANLSSAIISGNLYLRPKIDGDTIFYGGMTHKLKKLFSDRKIPQSKRKLIPILCDDKGVVWVPGFGVRDDAVSKADRQEIYAIIGITNDIIENRFYLGSEYKT